MTDEQKYIAAKEQEAQDSLDACLGLSASATGRHSVYLKHRIKALNKELDMLGRIQEKLK